VERNGEHERMSNCMLDLNNKKPRVSGASIRKN